MANHSGIIDDGIKFQIVPSTRKITVPQAYKVIGSVGDHNSEQLTFQCPKLVDGHDVSACKKHYVKWRNVKGDVGKSDLTNVTIDGDVVFFNWLIPSGLTTAAGFVTFSVHFEDSDGDVMLYRWSTASCEECQILDTLLAVESTGGEDEPIPVPEGYIKPTGTAEITENGIHDVSGYASADVAVPVPIEHAVTIVKNGTYEPDDGYVYNRVVAEVVLDTQEKEIKTNGVHTPDTGYAGFSKVIVNVPDVPSVLQEKTVYPTTSEQSVLPDDGFDGLSKVTVGEIRLQDKTVTQNGSFIADSGYNGLDRVIVDVQPELQTKNIDLTANGSVDVIADSGFYGLDMVRISVNVESGGGGSATVTLQDKSVVPNASQQVITPDAGYDGLSSVTVGAAYIFVSSEEDLPNTVAPDGTIAIIGG